MSDYELDDYTAGRLWPHVNKSDGCWEWSGHLNDQGYGVVQIRGTRHRVHRLSYELKYGQICTDDFVDHRCLNTRCVRPDHLRLVTNKQNGEHRGGANLNSKSGVRGVSWHKHSRKWVAQVRHERKNYYCGLYESLEEAEAVAIAKRNELFSHNDLDRGGDAL